MFNPDPTLASTKQTPNLRGFKAFTAGKLAKAALATQTTYRELSRSSRAAEYWRTVAPKQEQMFLGGCLTMWLLFDAASFSGYVILAMFMVVGLGRLAKNSVNVLAERLPRRSRSRHYLIAFTSVAFFSLLTARGCYLAAVIVDSQFRTDPLQSYSSER
ncbi:hypothetical protein [Rhizobium nepotum]|uniref:hypothetical protein n=1 Tax=Rhizobium nepotum TaxID=1035271 RepID=UPI003CF85180